VRRPASLVERPSACAKSRLATPFSGFRRRSDFAKDSRNNTCFTFADAACQRQARSPTRHQPRSSTEVTGRHVIESKSPEGKSPEGKSPTDSHQAMIHLMLIYPDPAMPQKAEPYAGHATPNCCRLDTKLLQDRGIELEPHS
jgi:hypothetical protein